MRARFSKLGSLLLALCFPWASLASGGMVMCFDSSGRIGWSPSDGLECARAESAAAMPAHTAGACQQCLGEDGCADIPGKGVLQRAPPCTCAKRLLLARSAPYALALGGASLAADPPDPAVAEPYRRGGANHGMRLWLTALRSVVLRL